MTRPVAITPLALLAAAPLAALIAWNLGGAAGRGALFGFLVGAGTAGLSFAWQRHHCRYHPERALRAHFEGFAATMAALLVSLVAVRAIAPVSEALDVRAYLLGFAAAVLVALPALAIDAGRWLQRRGRSA